METLLKLFNLFNMKYTMQIISKFVFFMNNIGKNLVFAFQQFTYFPVYCKSDNLR